jgi:hypothetical protein
MVSQSHNKFAGKIVNFVFGIDYESGGVSVRAPPGGGRRLAADPAATLDAMGLLASGRFPDLRW